MERPRVETICIKQSIGGSTMKTPEQLKLENIMSYCYGTENYYTNDYIHFKYTDGIKTFCKTAQAYWFLDVVESVLKYKPEYSKDLVAIKLSVQDNREAVITFEDSKKNIYKQDIPYTDCPNGEWVFYYEPESKVLMWNGEY